MQRVAVDWTVTFQRRAAGSFPIYARGIRVQYFAPLLCKFVAVNYFYNIIALSVKRPPPRPPPLIDQ